VAQSAPCLGVQVHATNNVTIAQGDRVSQDTLACLYAFSRRPLRTCRLSRSFRNLRAAWYPPTCVAVRRAADSCFPGTHIGSHTCAAKDDPKPARSGPDRQPARKTKRHADAILVDLKYRLSEIYDLNPAGSVLTWDEATYMPKGGAVARARQSALLRRVHMNVLSIPHSEA
jgi:hypothetical protein